VDDLVDARGEARAGEAADVAKKRNREGDRGHLGIEGPFFAGRYRNCTNLLSSIESRFRRAELVGLRKEGFPGSGRSLGRASPLSPCKRA
jgi:hypothetical protein